MKVYVAFDLDGLVEELDLPSDVLDVLEAYAFLGRSEPAQTIAYALTEFARDGFQSNDLVRRMVALRVDGGSGLIIPIDEPGD